MINNTLDFYNNNSKSYIESTLSIDMSHLYNDFLKHIPKGSNILDLGCGSGRDSLEFIKRGYNITAVDGSKELSIAASKIIGQEVICSKFEELKLTEISDTLQIGLPLVKYRLQKARKQLRELLGKEELDE